MRAKRFRVLTANTKQEKEAVLDSIYNLYTNSQNLSIKISIHIINPPGQLPGLGVPDPDDALVTAGHRHSVHQVEAVEGDVHTLHQ